MDIKKTVLIILFFTGCSLQSPPVYSYYRVRKGENIYDISEKYDVSVSEIVDLNSLKSGSIKGKILKLPFNKKRFVQTRENQRNLKKISILKYSQYINKLRWPADEREITSIFGFRPSGIHEGIDLAANIGTNIYASHKGKVVYSGNGIKGYGNVVIIKNEDIMTVYGHNSVNSVDVGDFVEEGEKIGEIGNTGISTGAHLHYEIRIKDSRNRYVAVDPFAFYN